MPRARRRSAIADRACAGFIAVAAILLFTSCRSYAHEVPSQLTVDVYIKPDHRVLHLLIRVPLSGLMGIDFPKEGVGYLALDRIGPSLQKAALLLASGLDIYEGGTRLAAPQIVATQVALPFDTSFASYDAAFAHLGGPGLPVDTQVYWLQGSVDALIDYPIESEHSSFSFRTRLTTLAPEVTTALRFVPPDNALRPFTFIGDRGTIWLTPSWYQTVYVFLKEGARLIPALRDQWLFALCMLIAARRLRSLPAVLASFGAGQVVTSILMAYGPDATGPWLGPLAATIIAAFLLCFAIENIAARRLDRRWTTLSFGVTSGILFSIAMRDIAQFAGSNRLIGILSFDLGVQAAEVLLFAVTSIPLLILSRLWSNERLRTIILSAFIANISWNTLTARGSELRLVPWPLLTPDVIVTATSWLIVFVVAAGMVWFVLGLQKSAAPRTNPALGKAEGS